MIKRKIFFKISMLILSVVTLIGCGNQLGIQPQQAIDASKALNSSSNVKDALMGAYERLQQPGLYGVDYNIVSELLAATPNELVFTDSYAAFQDIYHKRQVSNNIRVEEMWSAGYQAVNVANNVINAINFVDKADRNDVLGEAEFIRGISYFYLVRFFALPWNDNGSNNQMGVPLVLQPTLKMSKNVYVSRASVAQVYTQIIKDLKDAEAKLPKTNKNGRATTYAASAFLSEIYLQQGDYPDAAKEANRVIESGEYHLTSTYAAAFNNTSNSTEDVFAIQQNSQSNVGGPLTYYASEPGIGRASMQIDSAFIDTYPNGDQRKNFYYIGTGLKSGNTMTSKWKTRYCVIPIIRLAEMYLTRAECNFRDGTNIGATPVSDINKIRNRAGLPSLSSVTLPEILKERRLELAWEGKYLSDIKRLHESVGKYAWNSINLILPIPQRELDSNPNLKQTPGY